MEYSFKGFRSDTSDLVKMSEISEPKEDLKHSKMIVIRESGEVVCINSGAELAFEHPEADVIARWGGKWRSDLFKFKAKDYQQNVLRHGL